MYKIFDFLDQEYVEYIRQYYFDNDSQEGNLAGNQADKQLRDNRIVWFNDSTRWNNWIEFLKTYDEKIDWIQTPQISYYGPGQHYGWHTDSDFTRRTHKRYLTLNAEIQSAPGAGFEIKDHGIIKMKPGQAVVFPSKDLHRALPPTSGSRISFTIWGMALTKLVQ